jgi:hypothetical protein
MFQKVILLAIFSFLAISTALPLDTRETLAKTPTIECHFCEKLIEAAEKHYQNKFNKTTLESLKLLLDRECLDYSQSSDGNVAVECVAFINTHITEIFKDVSAGKLPNAVCKDLKVCPASHASTPVPPSKHSTTHAPALTHKPLKENGCKICQFVMIRAEHHLKNGTITKNGLLRELEHDCIRLSAIDGDQAAVECLNLAQNDISLIYKDIKAGKKPLQICQDVGECHVAPIHSTTKHTVKPSTTNHHTTPKPAHQTTKKH